MPQYMKTYYMIVTNLSINRKLGSRNVAWNVLWNFCYTFVYISYRNKFTSTLFFQNIFV